MWAQVVMVSGLGFVLFASIGGGYFLGWLVDRWLGTAPIFGLILAGLGMVGGLIEILQIMKRVEKRAGGNDN
jgi:F0F1-type ATP synthase assembly protein I